MVGKRGFGAMDQEKQRAIASKGGRAAHQKGTAHEFTSEEAAAAGRKGGEKVSRNRQHMAEIGRRGGRAAHRNAGAANHQQQPAAPPPEQSAAQEWEGTAEGQATPPTGQDGQAAPPAAQVHREHSAHNRHGHGSSREGHNGAGRHEAREYEVAASQTHGAEERRTDTPERPANG